MPSNFQMRGMHTILRDRETSNSDFVFYADRINRLLVEAGLGHLPFLEKIVTTPIGGCRGGDEEGRPAGTAPYGIWRRVSGRGMAPFDPSAS